MPHYEDSPEEAELRAATGEMSRIDDDLVNPQSHLERFENQGSDEMIKYVEYEIEGLQEEFQAASEELDRVLSKWGL